MQPVSGLSRVLGREKKESGYKGGNGLFQTHAAGAENCHSGDLTRLKIDSCWIINNSSAAGFPFRQKCPENIPAAEKKRFLMKRRCVENTRAARNHAAGVEAHFLRFCWRRWDEKAETGNGTAPSLALESSFTGAKLHFNSVFLSTRQLST